MAPESVSNVIALDLKWNNSRLECFVERYDLSSDFLYVSWNAIECPENYIPISNSVAYLWVPSGSTLRRYRARVDPARDGFEWVDHGDSPGTMLILTLPPDYVFVYPDKDVPDQFPVRFKSTEDSRMAFYWWFPSGRFQIIWHMKDSPNTDIGSQCLLLNEEARINGPPSPPHIDRTLKSIPSSQPQVINEPPQWHVSIQVADQATLVMGHQEQIDLFKKKVENVRQEKVINIGKGAEISAPLVIADTIENSFNTLKGSKVGDDVKQLLEQLLTVVNEINKKVPQDKSDDAEAMARDIETLVKEVASSKPRHQWYEVSLEGLKQAAMKIGEIADPVLNLAKKLMPLLLT